MNTTTPLHAASTALLLLSACGADDGGHITVQGECQTGGNRDSLIPCGLHDDGVLVETCSRSGVFELTATSTGTHVWVSIDTQECATIRAFSNEGVVMQDCTEGQWVDNETCMGTHGLGVSRRPHEKEDIS